MLEERICLASVAFAPAITTNLNSSEYFIQATDVGDVNNDGIPDVVVGRQDGSAQIYLGTRTGALTPATLAGPGAQLVALADFNNDGNLDLATAVGVLPGNGDGTFGSTPQADTYVLPAHTVALYAADVNGDGNQDLIAATFTPPKTSGGNDTVGISVMLGNGNGSFKAAVSTVVGSAPNLLQNAATFQFDDMNNDGILDLVSEFGVSLGKGDGTFAAAVPFPFTPASPPPPGSPPVPPALPSGPVFSVGDFNGDGNLDVAVLPPATAPAGEVEIFDGNGNGTFSDAGPVTIAAGSTITALDAEDINGDGNTDLIAGVTSTTNVSSLAVMTGAGNGTFSAPSLFNVSGPPITITSGDFNSDGNLDLLSIDAAAGVGEGTTGYIPSAATVLLNSQTLPLTPTVSLGAAAQRVVAGTQVKLTIVVQPPPPPVPVAGQIPKITSNPIPTGTIAFNNPQRLIGEATLKNGRASLTITASGVGVQTITATYSGDANYSAGNTASLNLTVLLTPTATPLLVPTLSASTLPSLFLPKDSGTATFTLVNGGGATASGRINIDLFLSASGIVDSSAIALSVPSLQDRAIAIASGGQTTLTGRFTAGSYPPGNYKLVAQIVPVSGLTSANLSQSSVVSSSIFQAAGMVFGTVGTHTGLKQVVTDASGDTATLTLSGGGYGTVTQNNGITDVVLTGTSSSSIFTIATRSGAPFSLDAIDVQGAIATINAATTTVTGSLTVRKSATTIKLGAFDPAGSAAVSVDIGSGGTLTLTLGAVTDADMSSSSAIRTLTAASWQGGLIAVPSITTLNVKGIFDPDLQTSSSTKLQTATLGTVDGGDWAIPGGIGTLRINGDFSNASIYAGANAGPDQKLGTSDDTYQTATITSVFIGGNVTSSLIAAGASPQSGGTIFTGIVLLKKSAIRAIAVRGQASADSRFLAASIPARVNIGGTSVATASDPRFQV